MASIVINGDVSGSVTLSVPTIAGTTTLTLPATSGTLITTGDSATVTPTMLSRPLTLGTAQASTSGTSIDFTGIPSWAKRITVMINGVSLSATARLQVQVGTSGGIVSTGYTCTSSPITTAVNTASFTSGFVASMGSSEAAGVLRYGTIILTNISGNVWTAFGNIATAGSVMSVTAGSIDAGATVTRVRITSTSTDTFDAGTINILYE